MLNYFPVLHKSASVPPREMARWPNRINWERVEPWREQLERNHGRTLEQLAASGGLTPVELWLGAHDLEIGRFGEITERAAARWLLAELA